MVEKVEPAREGYLTFMEFVRMMCGKHPTKALEGLKRRLSVFREWFELFDVDGDKVLPLSEFAEFMTSTGFAVNDDDLSEIDSDGNG